MKSKGKKVFVAMSGGVDSSVTATLLKEQGYDVVGIHIKMWSDPSIPCNFKEDIHDAARVAAVLDIPFRVWDLTKEYKKEVVDYMIREFKAGRTPNPDVMCNKHIKFGIFLKKALEAGADYVATGHYVRAVSSATSFEDTQKSPSEGFFSALGRTLPSMTETMPARPREGLLKTLPQLRIHLFKAKDDNKDQSYFLWTLTQKQLSHCLFPIGEYQKSEVRKLAKEFKLPTAEKKDSQGICFIGEIDLRKFLQKYIKIKPGKIITTSGKVVGRHEGLAFYTIGQRHGLGSGGGGIPHYVARKDLKKNTLVVAEGPYDDKLFAKELGVKKVNWISGKKPKLPLNCLARIRYRQKLQSCRIVVSGDNLKIVFSSPQRAVTPGQSVVWYKNGEVLGGGIIKREVSHDADV